MTLSLIVGGILGLIAGQSTERSNAMGIITNVIAGLFGAAIGQTLFDSWGPIFLGMAVIPTLGGSLLLLVIAYYFLHYS